MGCRFFIDDRVVRVSPLNSLVVAEFVTVVLLRGRHAELAKHLAWSGNEGRQSCRCALDPSGLKSLRMTPLLIAFQIQPLPTSSEFLMTRERSVPSTVRPQGHSTSGIPGRAVGDAETRRRGCGIGGAHVAGMGRASSP